MKTELFSYALPPELIAQTPKAMRDASRLMTLDKTSGAVGHKVFSDLVSLLRPGDLLVLNDSRVLPARLLGEIELLLLRDTGNDKWECLVKPGRKAKAGRVFSFGGGELKAEILEVLDNGNRLVKFSYDGLFLEILGKLGEMPLPPYIKEKLADSERYQTVYSKAPGSAAAPTAGLHFTPELLAELQERGVELAYITLHVGVGTFRPVKSEYIAAHVMHSEYCIVPDATAAAISRAKAEKRRVVAVGTTVCRSLEATGGVPYSGFVNCFIYPGYEFQIIDALITNFHLPESTLLMLVSALAGRENVLAAYAEAIHSGYRFFSFGDAMLIA
ncbi:MAG: tRNA preQ1(34) S-adenosylmethionine ribosyltransferase-isomerase QueA [Oscillospiraceae bacterium]|jgi:S-adenosylmethionine:tRNA ribosyltransferase-isomerase|nr:tRNA preQ1(34) S-adenosylmethionine ribosyltransferase-isomerase QueA [Oscillospiraceae bacterium]